MEVVSVNEARAQFSDLMAKVAYGGQRVIVERRGKPLVAWITIEALDKSVPRSAGKLLMSCTRKRSLSFPQQG